MTARSVVLAAVVLLLVPQVGLAQRGSPVGRWVGHWERGGSRVDIAMTISVSKGEYQGSFDSEGLRIAGIPMRSIRWAAPALKWEVVGDFSTDTFEGEIRGGRLSGRFRQGDASGTFSFTRSTGAPRSTQLEPISFRNGDVVLAGSVVRPTGAGPFPGIVFLHGSGAEGRWASRYLAEKFARAGFAALIFDKRGVGQSGGDWRQATFDDLAADGAAAFAALGSRPEVAREKVGIHGHSQGGTLAPMVAGLIGRPAFVIGSAASGVSMREAERFSVGNSIGVGRMSPEDAAAASSFIDALLAVAYDGQPYQRAAAAWEAVRNRPWAFALPPESDHYWRFSRSIAGYDPVAHWNRVSVPTLLVYGEGDERVPARASAGRIAAALLEGRGPALEVIFFPGADHTFRVRPASGGGFAWPTTAAGYPERVVEWAARAVGAPGSSKRASN